jgi:DNA (cytosine-5)-methyltransferase 1
VAGKQAGMTKGSGTASSLCWEVMRLLKECKEDECLPDLLVMENVPQVHGKKFMPVFQEILNELTDIGYMNYWQDLNAKNYGVAQQRNRCFMVSLLGNNTYVFPEPIPLLRRMRDYLDKEVDEKYYINNEKSENLIRQLIESGKLE